MDKPSNPTNLHDDEVAVDYDQEHNVQLPSRHETQLVLLNNAATSSSSIGVVDTESQTLIMSPTLFAAAMQGNLNIIRENESCLSTRFTRTGNSVLHIASAFEQLRCSQEIIQLQMKMKNADLVKKTNNKGETALHVAAKRGSLNIVTELVNFAAAYYQEGDAENEIGEESAVTELLRMKNKKGSTALHEAARYGFPDRLGVVKYLVGKDRLGVVKYLAGKDRLGVVKYLAGKDQLGVVKYLAGKDSNFSYGPNLNGETPLYIAAERGHHAAAIAILQTCKSTHYEGPLGRNALHAAVISNCQDITKKLMERVPSLGRQKDVDHWTPLHWAAFYNRSFRVTQLLSYDKSLAYIPDETGMIPLHVAGNRGNVDAIISLIATCPDCYDIVDNKGRNVIHHAVMNRQLGTVSEIYRSPLFISLLNEGDEDGNTPFHLYPDAFLPVVYTLPLEVDHFAVNANGLTNMEAVSRRHAFNSETLLEPILKFPVNLRPRKPSGAAVGIPRPSAADSKEKSSIEGDVESDRFKLEIESHLIVAALVATVAFAAGFTAPGGYDDKDGIAKLSAKFGFRCFIVFDAFALMLSFSAIMLYFISVYHIYNNKLIAYFLVFAGICLPV